MILCADRRSFITHMNNDMVFTQDFDRSFAQLTPLDQKFFDLAVMSFRRRPERPGLRLPRLGGGSSLLISPKMEPRVIVALEGRRRVPMRVDRHEAAGAWANKRRLGEHPVTGSMRMGEVVEIGETIAHASQSAPSGAEAAPTAPKLFAPHSNETKPGLGVHRRAEGADAVAPFLSAATSLEIERGVRCRGLSHRGNQKRRLDVLHATAFAAVAAAGAHVVETLELRDHRVRRDAPSGRIGRRGCAGFPHGARRAESGDA